jgi:hypothetical protein
LNNLRQNQTITTQGVFKMPDVKDYTEEKEYNHYNGVPSMYGKLVDEQCRMQPKYCEPGEAGGGMEGEKRNEQAGP